MGRQPRLKARCIAMVCGRRHNRPFTRLTRGSPHPDRLTDRAITGYHQMRPNADELFDELSQLDLTLNAIASRPGGTDLSLQQCLQRHVRCLRIFLDIDAAQVLHDLCDAAQRVMEANDADAIAAAMRDLARMRALLDAMFRRQVAQASAA